jgi:hypothetical protein
MGVSQWATICQAAARTDACGGAGAAARIQSALQALLAAL